MKFSIDFGRIVWVLLLFLQTITCVYMFSNSVLVDWIEYVAFLATSFYKLIGFEWHNKVALLLVYCFVVSFSMNIFISIINTFLPNGMPFRFERVVSLHKYWSYSGVYILAIVFFVGVWGSNISSSIQGNSLNQDITFSNIVIVSLVTFLICSIAVDVIEFSISATISKLRKL